MKSFFSCEKFLVSFFSCENLTVSVHGKLEVVISGCAHPAWLYRRTSRKSQSSGHVRAERGPHGLPVAAGRPGVWKPEEREGEQAGDVGSELGSGIRALLCKGARGFPGGRRGVCVHFALGWQGSRVLSKELLGT